jgi:hypothetical protein
VKKQIYEVVDSAYVEKGNLFHYEKIRPRWHWNNKLFWFRANQSLFFLLNDACLIAEKQQTSIS